MTTLISEQSLNSELFKFPWIYDPIDKSGLLELGDLEYDLNLLTVLGMVVLRFALKDASVDLVYLSEL